MHVVSDLSFTTLGAIRKPSRPPVVAEDWSATETRQRPPARKNVARLIQGLDCKMNCPSLARCLCVTPTPISLNRNPKWNASRQTVITSMYKNDDQ